jgi:hypothetical protein
MAVAHGDMVVFKPNWTALKSADPGTMQVMHATGESETHKLASDRKTLQFGEAP